MTTLLLCPEVGQTSVKAEKDKKDTKCGDASSRAAGSLQIFAALTLALDVFQALQTADQGDCPYILVRDNEVNTATLKSVSVQGTLELQLA